MIEVKFTLVIFLQNRKVKEEENKNKDIFKDILYI